VLSGIVTPVLMRRLGFSLFKSADLTYWHRPAPVTAETSAQAATPLVFVHGVGLGPLPYVGFIEELTKQSNGPTIVIELPFVAQRLSGLPQAPDEMRTVEAIAGALQRHNIHAATFVGHSLGTIYLSWVARLRPELLASAVFLDPICFLLHHSKVCANFLYAKPADDQADLEHYFIKSELSIVSYFHRHFYWYANNLWVQDLPCPTSVVLSENDNIVPVTAIDSYLRRRSVSVLKLDSARHGEFIMDKEARGKVLDCVAAAQHAGRRRAGVARVARWKKLRRAPRQAAVKVAMVARAAVGLAPPHEQEQDASCDEGISVQL